MSHVFEIYELVENIILSLPEENILLAANVSKTFLHVVQRSYSIRNKIIQSVNSASARGNITSSRSFESWYICKSFDWGTLILRRLKDAETMAILSPKRCNDPPRRLSVMDGKDEHVRIVRIPRYRCWEIEHNNTKTGETHTGSVSMKLTPSGGARVLRGTEQTALVWYFIAFH